VQALLLRAKHLFVAAMAAEVHPGLQGTGKLMTEGQSAFEAVKGWQSGFLRVDELGRRLGQGRKTGIVARLATQGPRLQVA
jgi:hypothetical protein